MLKYLVLFCAFLSFFSNSTVVPIEPIPVWVKPINTNYIAEIPKEDIRNGVYYLLADKQTLVPEKNGISRFRHYSTVATNSKGVQRVSQINIDYDPSYQKLFLHQLTIWRDGKLINKLDSSKMLLIQREKELDKLIYNGEKTLNILLDDVRINDVVDYSFSIIGSNPIFAGSFSIAHSLDWSVPIDSLYVRLIWNKSKKLNYRVKNTELTVEQKNLAGGTEYWLEDQNIAAVKEEKNTPSWFDPHGIVYFSEVENWGEVADWGTQLFKNSIQTAPQLKDIVESIKSTTSSRSQQIAKILQFVQTDIRYLGIEFGENSHKPSLALDTLSRHYGDCKDKVSLLISLLNELGVEAFPALVNTRLKTELINRLPSYSVFDHVIAKVNFDGKTYWLDPTRLNQAGDLQDIYQPNYSYALILGDNSRALTKIEIKQDESQIKVNEHFKLFALPDMTGTYESKTEYSRMEAEYIRGDIESKGLSQLKENYFEFYQGYYDSISVKTPLVFEDTPSKNKVLAKESYSLEDVWRKYEKSKKYTTTFYANLISPSIYIPESSVRKHPFALEYPNNLVQNIKVDLDDRKWNFKDKNFVEDNDFFTYEDSFSFDSAINQLSLNYLFKTKVDFVTPEDFPVYLAALKKIDKRMSYRIKKKFPKKPLSSMTWWLIGLGVFFCFILILIGHWRDKKIRANEADTQMRI